MYRALSFCVLFGTWIALSGLFDPFHLSLGVISCALVIWWSGDLMFPDRSMGAAERIRQVLRLPGWLLWLSWQIIIANWHVLKLALSPKLREEIEPQLVKFRAGLDSDFEKFILAQSITLTPGTVTLKIEGDEFLVHAISEEAAEGLKGEMAERIRSTFGREKP